MALTFQEFHDNWPTIKKQMLEQMVKDAPVCAVCPEKVLDSAYQIAGKPAHEDCYFSEFGKEIEAHPIFLPRRRGPHYCNLGPGD